MSAGVAAVNQLPWMWLVSRASGLMLLVLFSAVFVLGISTRLGTRLRSIPRFAMAELHRTLALFSVALLALHARRLFSTPTSLSGGLLSSCPSLPITGASHWVSALLQWTWELRSSLRAWSEEGSGTDGGVPCTGWRTRRGRWPSCTRSVPATT